MTMDEISTLSYDFVPSLTVENIETLTPPTILGKVGFASGTSPLVNSYNEFAPLYSQLERLGKDASLWVDEDTAPSAYSQIVARLVLQQLEEANFLPSKIVATADNGIAICFVDKKKYADIESTETGAVLGVLSDSINRPMVWEVKPSESEISQAVLRIFRFFESPSSSKDGPRAEKGRQFIPTLAYSVPSVS